MPKGYAIPGNLFALGLVLGTILLIMLSLTPSVVWGSDQIPAEADLEGMSTYRDQMARLLYDFQSEVAHLHGRIEIQNLEHDRVYSPGNLAVQATHVQHIQFIEQAVPIEQNDTVQNDTVQNDTVQNDTSLAWLLESIDAEHGVAMDVPFLVGGGEPKIALVRQVRETDLAGGSATPVSMVLYTMPTHELLRHLAVSGDGRAARLALLNAEGGVVAGYTDESALLGSTVGRLIEVLLWSVASGGKLDSLFLWTFPYGIEQAVEPQARQRSAEGDNKGRLLSEWLMPVTWANYPLTGLLQSDYHLAVGLFAQGTQLPFGQAIFLASVVVLLLALGALAYTIWFLWKTNQSLGQALGRVRNQYGMPQEEEERRPDPAGQVAEVDNLLGSLVEQLQDSQSQLSARSNHLEMLYRISEQFGKQRSLNGVVHVAVESIWQMSQVDYVAAVLGEDELGPFRYAGIRGVTDPLAILEQQCEVPLWGVLAQALVTSAEDDELEYLVIGDIEEEGRPRPSEFPWKLDQGSLVIIPLRHNDKTLGAMIIGSHSVGTFDDVALCHYLYAVSINTARAIQETQTRQQSNRWIRQLVSLQVLTRSITRAQELDKMFDALTTELHEMYNDVNVHVFLRAEEGNEGALEAAEEIPGEPDLLLYSAEAVGPGEREMLWSSPIMGLVSWVMEAEQPLFFDPEQTIPNPSELYYRSSGRALLVPIGEDEPLGAILVSAPERAIPFEESDMIVMRTVANSAAIAIGNVRLYRQLNLSQLANSTHE